MLITPLACWTKQNFLSFAFRVVLTFASSLLPVVFWTNDLLEMPWHFCLPNFVPSLSWDKNNNKNHLLFCHTHQTRFSNLPSSLSTSHQPHPKPKVISSQHWWERERGFEDIVVSKHWWRNGEKEHRAVREPNVGMECFVRLEDGKKLRVGLRSG